VASLLTSRRPTLTVTLLGLLAALPYALPAAARWRALDAAALARAFVGPWRGQPRTPLVARVEPEIALPVVAAAPRPTPSAAPVGGSTPRPRADPEAYARVPQPSGRGEAPPLPEGVLDVPEGALERFLAALDRAQRGEGVARVTHFGDSPVTGDLITGEVRGHLQRAFGDAGHGYLLPGRPWEWYGHLGVAVDGKGWTVRSPMLGQRVPKGGLAAVAFSTTGKATTRVTCARWVRTAAVELHYLVQPGGGTLRVSVSDQAPVEVSTRAEEEAPALATIEVEDDASHDVRVETAGDGPVTLYGLVLERRAPGVVYDALGANGAAIFHLAAQDGAHWARALQLRRPDLVVLAYGTNEAGYYATPGAKYVETYRAVLARVRQALPEASVLVMAPMDRGERRETGEIGSLPSLPRLVAAQRRAAREAGCAFFDTFAAMGGEGAAGRWLQSSPQLMTSDLTHPTRRGSDRLARLLVRALVEQLTAWRDGPVAAPAPSP
jgi:lysophospholipase L1-like esterase